MTIRSRFGRLRGHSLFLVYVASLLWLMLSCFHFANSAQIDLDFVLPLAVFTGVFSALYMGIARMLRDDAAEPRLDPLPERLVHQLIAVLFAVFCGVVVMHLTTLGYLPMVKAYQSTNDYEIARIRQEGYYTLAVWQRYASDYAIKGVGPILLVLAAQYRSRLFVPALLVGLFYATSLFVKANSVYLLLPLVLFFSFSGKLRKAAAVAALMVASVGVNWSSSSPPVREDVSMVMNSVLRHAGKVRQVPGAQGMDMSFPGSTVVASIRERLMIVPAQVTAQWYSFYEDPERRERGCGYRVLARIIGCEYQHIPTKLYALYYPELVKARGLTGSLNSGSYIHDFANFGYPGVFVGAIVFALLFTAVRFFCRNSPALLALSLMPVLSLPEMPISTVLNSGGWLLIMFVSILLQYGGRLRRASRPASA